MGFPSRLQQQDSCQSIRKPRLFACYQHQPCHWRAAPGTSGGRSACLSLTLEVTPLDTATIPTETKFNGRRWFRARCFAILRTARSVKRKCRDDQVFGKRAGCSPRALSAPRREWPSDRGSPRDAGPECLPAFAHQIERKGSRKEPL